MRNDFLSAPRLLSGLILMSVAITSVALFLAAPTRAAGAPPLSGPEISELISGTTVHLHTPVGGVLPVLYRHNGTLTGRAGAMLGFYLGASRDEGKWWIAGAKLCQQWNTWFKGKKNCLDIRRKGADFHWNDGKGESGLATIVSRSKKKTVVANRKPVRKKKHVRIGAPTGLGAPFPVPTRKPRTSVTEQTVPVVNAGADKPTAKKAVASQAKKKTTKRKTVVAAVVPTRRASLSPVRAATPGRSAPTKTPQQRWAERQVALNAEMKKLSLPRAESTARPRILKNRNTQAARTPRYRVVGVDPWDALNMRKNPDASGLIIATISPEAKGIEKSGACDGEWCRVKYAGRQGWVHQKFLARDVQMKPQKQFRVVGVYDGDVLNIRSQPSPTAPVAGAIAPNAKGIAVTGACNGEWCPIAHRQGRGWVHRYYIEPHTTSR